MLAHTTTQHSAIQLVEENVKAMLRELGFFKIIVNERKAQSLEILANGKMKDILVEVLIDAAGKKTTLTSRRKEPVRKSVRDPHRELWTAIAFVDENGSLVSSIEWSNIS